MAINKKKLAIFFLSLYVFFCIAENLPEYRYIIALVMLVISRMFSPEIYINRQYISTLAICVAIIFLLSGLGHMEVLTYKNNIEYNTINALLSLNFKLILVFFAICCCKDKFEFYRVIGYCIVFHSSFFVFQVLMVYSTGFYIDAVFFFSGEVSRYGGGFTLPFIGSIYRGTGMYVEPSTYASFVTILVILRLNIKGSLDRVDWIAIITCIFTFSIAAIFNGVLISALYFLRNKNGYEKKIVILFPVLAFFPVVYSLLYEIIEKRISYTNGTAISIRENLVNVVFDQSWSEVLLGSGLLGYPTDIAHYLQQGTLWEVNLPALNDNGMWLFIIIKFGVLGLFFLIIFFKKIQNDIGIFIITLIVFLTKISILNFIFILLISALVCFKRNGNCKEKNIIYS